MAIEKLTDVAIRRAIRHAHEAGNSRKLFDGDGLHLCINTKPIGSDLWRLKFSLDGVERTASFGPYPRVTLADARERSRAARKLIDRGIDPVAAKREKRATVAEERRHLFKGAAEAYFKDNVAAWSESHQRDVRRILDEIGETLGERPLASIGKSDVQRVVDTVVARNALTYARDVRLYFRQVIKHFNAAREHPIADPSALVAIPKAPPTNHHAMLEAQEIPEFLQALANSDAGPMTRIAVRLLMLSALRTTELRLAEWSEIDSKEKLWRVPQRRMKGRAPHLVPLSTQGLRLLADLRRISGTGALMFPNFREPEQPMSEATIITALYRMGYKGRLTSHGFRSMFSSWANEHGYNSDAIELQLGHVPANKVRATYNRASYLTQRRELMQAWADYLDECERSARVIPIHSGRA
jgi:integrase